MESEFAVLNDMALAKGVKLSDLIDDIHDAILVALAKEYPDISKNAEVLLDAKSGKVRIMSDKSDVTPDGFGTKAESIARKIILKQLKSKEIDQLIDVPQPKKFQSDLNSDYNFEVQMPQLPIGSWLGKLLFWGYNLMFVLFWVLALIGFLTSTAPSEWLNSLKILGFSRLIVLSIYAATPLIVIYWVIKKKLFNQTSLLLKIFFILEVPTIIIAIVLSGMSDALPIYWLFGIVSLLIPWVLYAQLEKIKADSANKAIVGLVSSEIIVLIVGYATLLYTFYIPAILAGIGMDWIAQAIRDIGYEATYMLSHPGAIFEFLILLFYMGLGFLFITIIFCVIASPYVLTLVLYKFWRKYAIVLAEKSDWIKVRNVSAITGLSLLVLVVTLSWQPSVENYIEKLENYQNSNSFEERMEIAKELMESKSSVEKAFENMYSARSKYWYHQDSEDLKNLYKRNLGLGDTFTTQIQNLFLFVAYPLVYQGPISYDQEIVNTYNSLFYEYQQNNQPKNVKLNYRQIDVKSDYNNLLATVTIEEEYNNKVWSNQEVIYEFSLPNDAVVTDLKLGSNLEFQGIVAPIGAAREVYQQQLVQRRDPALLEQTGPRQYRLRVFPIPANNDRNTLGGKLQKVSFSYVVGATKDGYPLPKYSRVSNVDTDRTNMVVIVNGKRERLNIEDEFVGNNNLIGDICAANTIENWRSSSSNINVQLVPHATQSQLRSLYNCNNGGLVTTSLLNNKKIALLYDTSYMNEDSSLLNEVTDKLERNNEALINNNQIDWFWFNDKLSKATPLNKDDWKGVLDEVAYFGKSDLLMALSDLRGSYDAVVVLTASDQTPESLSKTAFWWGFPVYIVHEDKKPAYNQAFTNSVLQSSGLMADNLDEALNHIALKELLTPNDTNRKLLGVYSDWSLYLTYNRDNNVINSNSDNLLTEQQVLPVLENELDTINVFPLLTPTPTPDLADKLDCYCNDGAVVTRCVEISCSSSRDIESFCNPACNNRGGTNATACLESPQSCTPSTVINPNFETNDDEWIHTALAFDKNNPLSMLTGKAWLYYRIADNQRVISNQMDFMDNMHSVAKKAGITSPFSSYISLVNAQQLAQLESESKQWNRFQEGEQREAGNAGSLGIPAAPVREFGISNPLDSFFGLQVQEIQLPTPYNGGGGDGVIGNIGSPSSDGLNIPTKSVNTFSVRGPLSLGGGMMSLFILGNVVLIVGGGIVWGVIYLKNKKNQLKESIVKSKKKKDNNTET